jgi:hypothetical protein
MGVPCGVAAVKELRRLGFELREQQWSHRVARCKPNDASLEERMDLASFTDPTKVVENRLDSFVIRSQPPLQRGFVLQDERHRNARLNPRIGTDSLEELERRAVAGVEGGDENIGIKNGPDHLVW